MSEKKITIRKTKETSTAPETGAASSLRAGTSTSASEKKVRIRFTGVSKAKPVAEEPVKTEQPVESPKARKSIRIRVSKPATETPAPATNPVTTKKGIKIKVARPAAPIEEKPVVVSPVEETIAVEEAPATNVTPIIVPTPVVVPAPVEEKPTEETAPVNEEKPVVEEKVSEPVIIPAPIVVEAPTEETAPVEEPAPVVSEPIVETPAPVEEKVSEPAQTEEPAPIEKAPAPVATPVEEPVVEETGLIAMVRQMQSEGYSDEEILLAMAKMAPREEPAIEEEPQAIVEEPAPVEEVESAEPAEEPVQEEPVIEPAEEVSSEEPIVEEPVIEESPVEEPAVEEVESAESVEEPVQEEPAPVETPEESVSSEEAPLEEVLETEEQPTEAVDEVSNEEPVTEEVEPVEEPAPVVEDTRSEEEIFLEYLAKNFDEDKVKEVRRALGVDPQEEVEEAPEEAPVEEPVQEEPVAEEPKEEFNLYAEMDQDAENEGDLADKALDDTGYSETVLEEDDEPFAEESKEEEVEEESVEESDDDTLVIPDERPRKYELEEPVVQKEEPYDYASKNKIIEDTITSAIAGDNDIARLSELLSGGSIHTLRFKREETGSFDMTWIRALEDAIPAIDEILKNPRITTKIVTDIVPVELAKKTGSESVKHLASHTQYVKDIDEDGNVIPSKILNIGSDDEYITYENRFVATAIRRLVLFVEKRYEYLTKYSSLKNYEILYIKNHANVNGLDVDVQSKVVVSRPSINGSSVSEADDIMRRINLLRRYAKFFYSSDFMKRFKNEKNVRSPIMQTNIIRKNPKYHKVYNLFRFMESYAALGVEFTTRESYFGVEETDKQAITNISLANFLAVKCEPSMKDVVTKVEVKKPEVMTNIDDDIFTFFPVGAYPEFIRIDEEYIHWKERNTSDLVENPSPEEKAYRGNDYLRKKKSERERARREALIARREAARAAFLEEQEALEKAAEEERRRQEILAKEAEERAALAELEEAREFVRNAAYNEDEDLLLATVIPIEITISGENEIVAKTTYAHLETKVEFFIADPSLVWTSSDESVATVDETGFVSGWKEGDVTIRATSVEDPTCFADYQMHVSPRPPVEVYIEPIEKIIVSKEATLTPIVRNADDTSVMWSTSNAAVCSVEEGVIKAHSTGRCIITAYSMEDNKRSCSIVVEPLDGIELRADSHSLISRRTTLDLVWVSNVSPDDMVMFFSSDENIATVSTNGCVEGVSWDGGDVVITAVSTLDPTLSAKFNVHVEPKPIVSVEIEGRAISILNRANKLEGIVINAIDSTTVWSSSNEDIATVDEYGYVTGVSLGKTTITCRSSEEPDKFATLDIEVKEAVIISSPNFEVVAKKTIQFSAITNVTDDDSIIWSTSNEEIATVDENGLVTGVSTGNVVVTASSSYDPELYANYELYVRPEVEVRISGSTKAIVTKDLTFEAEVLNAYDPSYRWESSDENIMNIDENGVGHANMAGVVVITVTSIEDDTKSASLEVNVVDGIELTHDEECVVATHSVTWSAKSNVSETDTILWSSSNIDVALVNQEGVIAGIEEGVATITAASIEDPTLSSSCDISVAPAIIIELEGNPILIKERSGNITANVKNANDASLVYTSSDESILSIIDNTMFGNAIGHATITATSVEDNTRSATFDVEVKDGIELSYEETSFVAMRGSLTLSAVSNIEGDSVTWTSSDESVAVVEDGVVKASNPIGGKVTIKAASSSDVELYKEVEVTIEPKPIIEVTLEGEGSLVLGRTLQLSANIINALDPAIIWSSSDESVATVDENGLITPHMGGSVTITASSKEEEDKSASRIYEIITGVVIDEVPTSLAIGRSSIVKVFSNVGENDTIIYAVNDENIAKVDSNGKITGISEGDVELTVSSSLDMTSSKTCIIHIKPTVEVSIVGDDSVVVGQNISLTAEIKNADDVGVIWSSSDEEIITVDENGVVTGVKEGIARAIATSTEDSSVYAEEVITVIGAITLDKSDNEVMVSSTLKLNASSNIDENESLTWSSSDESVATVEDGNVKGVKEGEVTIKVSLSSDPSCYVEKTITVTPKEEIEIDLYGTNKVYVGKESTFSCYVSNGEDSNVIWSSSNESVATVSQDGVVTPIAPGNATITVTYKEDESKSASIDFTVVDGVTIVADAFEVIEGESIAWEAKSEVSEDDAVIWTTSDENIATVYKGLVTGVSIGVATITATSVGDSTLKASKDVTVIEKPVIVPVVEEEQKPVAEEATENIEGPSETKDEESKKPEVVEEEKTEEEIVPSEESKEEVEETPIEEETEDETPKSVAITSIVSELSVNQIITLSAVSTVGDDDKIVWSTSDKDIAAIKEDGTLRGIDAGAVTITATSSIDPEYKATITLYVKPIDGEISEEEIAEAIEEEKAMEVIREKKAAALKKGHRRDLYLKKKKGSKK